MLIHEHIESPRTNRPPSPTVDTATSSPEPGLNPPPVSLSGDVPLSQPLDQVLAIARRVGVPQFPPEPLATSLVDQLEQAHRCPQHPSRAPDSTSDQASLSTVSAWACPDVLSQPTMAQYGVDWNALFPVEQRRKVFTGLVDSPPAPPGEPAPPSPPVNLDLESDNIGDAEIFEVWLDVDSAGGLASSLAIAREGIVWKAGRAAVSNLQSSLHLDYLPVRWYDPSSGRHRTRHRPVHQIPHLPFGELAGFREIELYLIFPGLYDPTRDHWVITREEYETWTNQIFIPSLDKIYPGATVQHLPSSAEHIRLNGTAAAVEGRARGMPDASYTQDFHYLLQADLLPALWNAIQARSTEAGLTHFQGASILLTAKNLKLSTRARTWAQSRDLFFQKWNRAINAAYLQQDFYDIAKEVIPCLPATGQGDHPASALTLSWRRCCLDDFCCWLAQSAAASGAQSDGSSSPAAAEPLPEPTGQTGSSHDSQSDESSPEGEPAVTEPSLEERPRWRREFYPQSLTRDQVSLTIAPFIRSPLRKRGLLYAQLYNTSKEIFAAGNAYPFGNPRLDTLALDPSMLRSWQHVGGAVSHSPLALIRAYLHTKQRCHTALQGCRSRSYGTREEYRVTGAVLEAMDEILQQRQLAHVPFQVPQGPRPFFAHPTPLIQDWWRWNINKLCLGFEMTYSLRDRTLVHWEHTRVMMMFLKCLGFAYGGQGKHPRQSLGLWIDQRHQPPSDGSDTEQVQEGMGMGDRLEGSGYAWLADKVDWAIMVFRPFCRRHMVFNTPSVQSAYHGRYQEVKEAKAEFLLFHDITLRLHEHLPDPDRSALLLQLLCDLCLRAFRQEVFRHLAYRKTTQPLQSRQIAAARSGNIPLTSTGVRSIFESGIFEDDLHFAHKAYIKVTHIDTLFVWLWGWDGDGNQGDWPRKHWEYKPYRILYRQCYGIIAQTHGMRQARAWRQLVKDTWIRTHWILPYPGNEAFWSRTRDGKLQTWSSIHLGVMAFYQRQGSGSPSFSSDNWDTLPVTGWECGTTACPFQITLPIIPEDLAPVLAVIEPSPSTIPRPEIPLPHRGMRDTALLQYLRKITPAHRELRSFCRRKETNEDEVHGDPKWLQRHLVHHLRASIVALQQEITSLDHPIIGSRWRARSRPSQESLGGLAPQLDDEDSDSYNYRAHRERLNRRLRRMRNRLQEAERVLAVCRDAQLIITRHRPSKEGPLKGMDQETWKREHARYEEALRQQSLSRRTLKSISKHSVGPWF